MGLSDSRRDQLSPREEQIYLVPFHSAGVRKAGAPLERLGLSLLGRPSFLALEPAVNPGPQQWHPVGSPKEGLGSSCIFGVNFVAGLPGGSDGKATAYNTGDPGLIPRSGRSLWRSKWQPTLVFLLGKFHEWRSLGELQSRGSQRVGHD